MKSMMTQTKPDWPSRIPIVGERLAAGRIFRKMKSSFATSPHAMAIFVATATVNRVQIHVVGTWVCLAIVVLLSVVSSTAVAQIPEGDLQIRLQTVISFDPTFPGSGDFELTPTDLIPLDDGTGRNLLATLGGTIRVIDANDQLLAAPLLTTTQVGLQLPEEAGMTGLAVHPDFSTPNTFGYGKLYTVTPENGSGDGGLTNGSVDFPWNNEVYQDVIREWDISAIVGNPNVNSLPAISLSDSREILRIDQPGPYHNLYDFAFSPVDNLLYLAVGDGGRGGTVSQDQSVIYGNMLRIDPDPTGHTLVRNSANTGLPAYSIPDNNPFNGDDATETKTSTTLAEIWAYGIRSPYRMSFDRLTGNLYFGDVGSSRFEEINLVVGGGNYGWPNREGVEGSQPSGGSIDPLFHYSRNEGRTVVGGFVYRGEAIPDLQGKYLFAEFGQRRDSARLFYGIVDPDDPDGNVGDFFEFTLDETGSVFPIDTDGDFTPDEFDSLLPDRVFSIGEDETGELYLVAGQDPRGAAPSVPGAFLVKLVPSPRPGDFDLDGDVDGQDFLAWQRGESPNALSQSDLDTWRANYGDGIAPLARSSTVVPEPSTMILLLTAACARIAMRERSHRRCRGRGHP